MYRNICFIALMCVPWHHADAEGVVHQIVEAADDASIEHDIDGWIGAFLRRLEASLHGHVYTVAIYHAHLL
jgi:hypothetical protein